MNDELDTELGNSATTEDKSLKISANITFEQELEKPNNIESN